MGLSIHYVFGGKVLVYEPGKELTVGWGWIPPRWPDVSLLTTRLEPAGSWRTRVEIVHRGFARLGDRAEAIYRSFEGGWDLLEPVLCRNLCGVSSIGAPRRWQAVTLTSCWPRTADERALALLRSAYQVVKEVAAMEDVCIGIVPGRPVPPRGAR